MWSPFFSAFSCNSHLTLSGFPCAKSVVAFKSSKPSHCTSWCTFSYGCYIPKYNTKYHEAAGCKMWHLCRAGASCNVELPPLATVSNFGVPTPTTTRMNSIILTSVYNCSQMSEGEQHGGTNSAFCTHGSPIDRPRKEKFPEVFSSADQFSMAWTWSLARWAALIHGVAALLYHELPMDANGWGLAGCAVCIPKCVYEWMHK